MLRSGIFVFILSFLVACSGSKPLMRSAPAQSSEPSPARISRPAAIDSAKLLRLEIAHGSFLRALALERQGELELAEQFMLHASEADSGNRYLAFSVLDLMLRRGEGSSEEASKLAERAKSLKGKRTSNQYYILGRVYSERSNLDSALLYYKKAVDTGEQNLHAAYEYSLLLEISHDTEELVRVYGLLLPQIGFPQAMLERQISLLAETRNDSAMADLFGAVYEARGDRAFLENRIRLLLGMKRFEEALSATEEFRADSAFADDSLSVAFLVAAYTGLERDSVATDTLRAIYKRNPNSGNVLLKLALFETKLGEKEQAKIHWERLSGMDRFAGAAFGMLSVMSLDAGDSAKSLEYLERAYRREPAAFRNNLIARYAYAKDFVKAYPLLDEALVPDARIDSAREKILASGNLEELRKFDAAATLAVANVHFEYGTLLQMNAEELEAIPTNAQKKDSAKVLREKAQGHYGEAARIGGETQNLLFACGSNMLSLGKVDSAIVVFRKIFQKYPADAMSKNHLGYTLVDLNRNADELKWGISLIDEALALNPDEIAYKDSKGWALYREGKFREALAVMENVESKRDSFPEMFARDTSIYAHLAAICQALSLSERAVGYYRKVLEIDPQNDNAKRQIEILTKKEE